MKIRNIIGTSIVLSILMAGCGGKDSSQGQLTGNLDDRSEEYLNSDVNAIDQAQPEIMVIPSDALLQKYGCISNTSYGVERDYQQYLLENRNNKAIVSAVEDFFISNDYPLTNLEQSLKQLQTSSATDEADDLAKDAKTLLMETAHPDIIVEVDYKSSTDRKSFNTTYSFILSMIDPYTSKVFSTKKLDGADGADIADVFNKSFSDIKDDVKREIRKYFSDILTKGREISLRVSVENRSNITLKDESVEGETYSDWIEDYLDTHTVKGSYKLRSNTKYEMSFIARIPTLNNDGTQYSGYQWGREFAKAMRKQLGVKVVNNSQGLADIHLVITGI